MRVNAPKQVTCPKGVSHRTFRRQVELEGIGNEVLDDELCVVAIGNPNILRVRRADSTVYCATCGSTARVIVGAPLAWRPSGCREGC